LVRKSQGQAHALELIHAVCCLAGCPSLIDDVRTELVEAGILDAIEVHDTAKLFDWIVPAFSYLADAIATDYMDRHGVLTWAAIATDLAGQPSCPKLQSYWHFHDCGYRKIAGTCNEPGHFSACPLPLHPPRNGRLNQTAYSLFLFIRDLADGDLVAWIDRCLAEADDPSNPDRAVRMGEALVGPLRHVHGVSDKVLTMTLSGLLLASQKPRWTEAGAHMIAIDTLVHIFCTAPASCTGSAPTIFMALAAINRTAAPTSFARCRLPSMPDSSTAVSQKSFPGSCSMRFGATALAIISTFATAIASMTASHAKTAVAGCTGAATVSH
jgi:hypothetical protein